MVDTGRIRRSVDEWGPVVLAGTVVALYLVAFQWTATRLYLLNFSTAGPNATAVLLVLLVTGWVVGLTALLNAGAATLYVGGSAVTAGGVVLGFVENPFVAGLGGVGAATAATAVAFGLLARDPARFAVGAAGGLLVYLAAGTWFVTAPLYAIAGGRVCLALLATLAVATAVALVVGGALSAPNWSAVAVPGGTLAAFLLAEAVWLASPHALARWHLRPYWLAVAASVLGLVAGAALVERRPARTARSLSGWAAAFVLAVAGLVALDPAPAVALAAPAQAGAVVLLAGGSRPGETAGSLRPAAGMAGVQFVGVVLVFLFVSATNWAYVPGPLAALRGYDPALLVAVLSLPAASAVLAGRRTGDDVSPGIDHSRRAVGAAVALGLAGLGGLVTRRIGSPARDAPGEGDPYRLATYNVHQYLDGTGAGRYNLEPLAAVLERTDPDVVGLQESEGARVTSGTLDGVRWLARRLGYHAVYGAPTAAGSFGVALLSRWPVEDISVFELPVGDSVVRPTLVATVDAPRGPLRTVVTHFEVDTPGDRHEAAADRVRRSVEGSSAAVVLGDCNFTPDDPAHDRLATELTDAWAAANGPDGGGTYPAGGPTERIDYVWLRGDWRVESARTVGDDRVSDHRGVLARAVPPDQS